MLTLSFLILLKCTCSFVTVSSQTIPIYDRIFQELPPEVKTYVGVVEECKDIKKSNNTICSELFKARDDNLKQNDVAFVQSLLREILTEGRIHKRQARRGLGRGRIRRRMRKEVRRMSRAEWNNLVQAIQSLKQKGIYDRLSALHRGVVRIDRSHFGPAFFGWHRIYLLLLEHALRRERSGVTIPYWDSTLDYDMNDPRDSILWTDEFFGNGDGRVRTGPFSWRTSEGDDLVRNIGSGGSLISKESFQRVLSRRRHREIIDEFDTDHWLEGFHNGPHEWVDGQMSLLDSAPEDPVFWFHHSFIDYWWQLFMNQQIYWNGIDPFNDYPDVTGYHDATNTMDPFNMTNRAGYHQFWYRNFYTYQRSPTCSTRPGRQSCGSPYLWCHNRLQRCVSLAGQVQNRNLNRNRNTFRGIFVNSNNGTASGIAPAPSPMPVLRTGRRFASSVRDPRTTGNKLRQS